MRFKATEEKVKTIMMNAVNASIHVGMGMIHFQQKDYCVADMPIVERGRVDADYFHGRMVKLSIVERDGDYEIPNGHIIKPDKEYQSWATKYPTYKNLLLRSGINEEDILD